MAARLVSSVNDGGVPGTGAPPCSFPGGRRRVDTSAPRVAGPPRVLEQQLRTGRVDRAGQGDEPVSPGQPLVIQDATPTHEDGQPADLRQLLEPLLDVPRQDEGERQGIAPPLPEGALV